MAGMLRRRLETLPGPGWLCWYGDHVPIMPEVYRTLQVPDGRTDYLIWGSDQPLGSGTCLDTDAASLGRLMLERMGLLAPDQDS